MRTAKFGLQAFRGDVCPGIWESAGGIRGDRIASSLRKQAP